jgi:phosphate starvation-inducible PhoH-like protein
MMTEQVFTLNNRFDPMQLYGSSDRNLKEIENHFKVRLVARGHEIKIIGEEAEVAYVVGLFEELTQFLKEKKSIESEDLLTAIKISRANGHDNDAQFSGQARELGKDFMIETNDGIIRPRSEGQSNLFSAFRDNDIIFAIGPAGTGKTYLSVAIAVSYLKSGRIRKLVLARPAVEAGESLGFLPGDYKEKIDPYLKPLYDALEDMLPRDILKKHLEQETIEVIPLAYMRGRTLNNAFVILDEAQNTTFTQMKMFLTRLGKNSKAAVTGDITQIDLPKAHESGLRSSIKVLDGISGIAFVYLHKEDVVRHALVKDIIDAYDRFSKKDEA